MATHSSILPEKSLGQRTLAGYNPWDCKESDTTKVLSMLLILSVTRERKKSPNASAHWERREELSSSVCGCYC